MRMLLVSLLAAASLCLPMEPARASVPAEALLQRAEAIRSSRPDEFQEILARLEVQQRQLTAKQQEQLSYLKAYAEAYHGRYEAAAEQAKRLVETSRDVAMQFRAGGLMVNSYSATRHFTEGLRQLERTMLLIDKIKDPELRQHGLFVAAQIYNRVGQDILSIKFADRILAETAPERTQCFAQHMKTQALLNLRALPVDDDYLMKVIAQCGAAGEAVLANSVRGTLARKWVSQGRHGEAIALLRRHLPEMVATRFPLLIGDTHSMLAEFLFAKGDLDQAERHVKAAIANRSSLANSPPLVAAYKVRYQIAERRGDTAAALAYHRSFAEADKNYLNDVKARELAFQIVRHETQQKTQQIALLDQQNKVLQLQQRVQKQANQNLGLVVVLLGFLLAGLSYWAYRVKRTHGSLRRIAQTDSLTGISNRHHFTQLAEGSLSQCRSAGEAAAVIMFDLDGFKAINDTYGHEAGDWVLTQVAGTCRGLCRRIDHFGRIGGEEFAILLHGCELRTAVRLAEDCRVRLNQIDTRPSGHTFSVTASFGVSATTHSGYGLSELMSHADLMLYRAKREGRDRVRAYTGDLPSASPIPTPLPLPLPVQMAAEGDVATADSSGAGRSSRGGTS